MKFKGSPGPHRVREEPSYDSQTGQRFTVVTYQGTEGAIKGMTGALESAGMSYNITALGNGIWELQTRQPLSDPSSEAIDKWELTTEAHSNSIFSHPDVVDVAASYDASLSTGNDTWRQLAEKAVNEKLPTVPGDSLFFTVVKLLKDGVDGYETDNLVLRRTRQIYREFLQGPLGVFTIGSEYLIYSTGQLLIPTDVGFLVPATPPPYGPSGLYVWGWKRRSQRVENVGSYVEQTVEFLFAAWNTLTYDQSSTNFAW